MKPQRTALPPRLRPSFTLVELLVAIAIIGIMAGMVLYSLLGAQTDARVARTRGTIQKINEIILQQWEEYRYRAVDVRDPVGGEILPRERARIRMLVLRDMMRMEMPDRITDLLYGPTQYTAMAVPTGGTSAVAVKLNRGVPPRFGLIYNALRNAMAGKPAFAGFVLDNIDSGSHPLSGGMQLPTASVAYLGGAKTADEWASALNRVESSELLYLIVASSNYGGSSALEYFRSSEVGDPDEDGLLEFVDAWQRPIQWIRWPAGFNSDLVRYAGVDAMDPLKTDWRYRPTVTDPAWHPKTLVPLIISAGPNEAYGVTFDDTTNLTKYATMTWPSTPNPPFGTTFGTVSNSHYAAGTYFYPDPFFTFDGGPPSLAAANQIGSVPGGSSNEDAADNVTNHDIILEP